MKLRLTTILILILAFYGTTKAQTDSTEEFLLGKNIYKPNANWLTIGQGASYNVKLNTVETNTMLAFSFHIKQHHFRIGYHTSSDKFFTEKSLQRLIDYYVTYGIRKETIHYNMALFCGFSYAYGSFYDHAALINNHTEKYYKGFTQPGLFGIAEFTYKILYDIGIGTSLYISCNTKYQVIGLQIHFYLSGAYKSTIE